MENREIKIKVPEGYEIDRKNSTFECIKFKPASSNYDKVVEKLFANGCYCINFQGEIGLYKTVDGVDIYKPNNCVSLKQANKLLAMNKLMNVAKYLNGDWRPNWSSNDYKYYISVIPKTNEVKVNYIVTICSELVYFKTEQLALEALHILGEDTILLAYSTDW